MDIDKMDKKELIDKISDEIISKLKKTSSSSQADIEYSMRSHKLLIV